MPNPTPKPTPKAFLQYKFYKVKLRSKTNIESSDLHSNMSGLDLRTAGVIWQNLAESEARLHLMVELGDMEVGFPDVEHFYMELESNYSDWGFKG